MSYTSLTTKSGMTAEIWRRQDGEDRFGQPIQDYGTTPVQTYPCRVSYAGINASNFRSGEMATERYVDLVGETRLVFLPKGADVSEKDQIRVINEDGEEILPMTLIYSVRRRYEGIRASTHHTEVVTTTFRDAGFQQAAVS